MSLTALTRAVELQVAFSYYDAYSNRDKIQTVMRRSIHLANICLICFVKLLSNPGFDEPISFSVCSRAVDRWWDGWVEDVESLHFDISTGL